MAKIELELNEATIERLKALAQDRHASIENVIEEVFSHDAQELKLPGWGLFADEPEVVDEIMGYIMESRQQRNERLIHG